MTYLLRNVIALQGGSFDPIHNGHLALAQTALATGIIDQYQFIPNYLPVHNKTLHASSTHRVAMLELALQHQPCMKINRIELDSKKACFAINTLRDIRTHYPDASLCWVMGSDLLATLDQWHQWQSLTDYCHLLVATRPGAPWPQRGPIARLIGEKMNKQLTALQKGRCGCIIPLTMTPMDISATMVRQAVKNKQDLSNYIPSQVIDYINKHTLYR